MFCWLVLFAETPARVQGENKIEKLAELAQGGFKQEKSQINFDKI